jgi:hypothetical protein
MWWGEVVAVIPQLHWFSHIRGALIALLFWQVADNLDIFVVAGYL